VTREEHLLRLLRAANQHIELLEESLQRIRAGSGSLQPPPELAGVLAFSGSVGTGEFPGGQS
jgi:hypothetical protein